MATLPRPDVAVNAGCEAETGTHHTAITVNRDGRARTWSGSGVSPTTSTAEAVKKMLDDPITAEYVKESR